MAKSIPSIFFSFDTNQPFDKCIECEKSFSDESHYVIEKAIRTYPGFKAQDVIFDYAICLDCAMNMRNSFSNESRRKMDEYFLENCSGIYQRQETDQLNLEKCLIKGTPVSKLQEYQIYAHCKGQFLSEEINPYMISGAAQEEVMNLISNSTTDLLNGFFDKHFSPDPELVKPRPVLI